MNAIALHRKVESPWLAAFAVTLVQLSLFVAVSRFRFIDGDEGFYLLAARKVAEGHFVYRDFFYPQMPFLPSIYGFWTHAIGDGWLRGRLLSCIFAALTGTLLFEHLRRTIRSNGWALLGTLLYATSGFTLTWHTTVKTYALSTFLLICCWVCAEHSRTHRGYCLSGIFLGLSVSTRLFFAGIAPVLAFVAWRRAADDDDRAPKAVAWLLGFAVGLVPALIFALIDRDAFIYNNLLYHANRSGLGLIADLPQKLHILAQLFALGHPPYIGILQPVLLWIAIAVAAIRARSKFTQVPNSVLILFSLAAVSLLPTPCWYQYFSVLAPFLADAVTRSLCSFPPSRGIRFLIGIGLIGYLVLSGLEVDRITRTGKGLPLVDGSQPLSMWHIEEVEKVTKGLDRMTGNGERVLTWWPGYFIGGHVAPVPGLENHFAFFAAHNMNFEQRRRYHVLSTVEAGYLIETQQVRSVLLGIFVHNEGIVPRLRAKGYKRTLEIPEAGAELWQIVADKKP